MSSSLRNLVQLTESQWKQIEACMPETRTANRGRLRISDQRCFHGVLWVLYFDLAWCHMPSDFPSGVTCRSRLSLWNRIGCWQAMWRSYLESLDPERIEDWKLATRDWRERERKLTRPLSTNAVRSKQSMPWREHAVNCLWTFQRASSDSPESASAAACTRLLVSLGNRFEL